MSKHSEQHSEQHSEREHARALPDVTREGSAQMSSHPRDTDATDRQSTHNKTTGAVAGPITGLSHHWPRSGARADFCQSNPL